MPENKNYLPKPKAQLNLDYPVARYIPIESSCPYLFDINASAAFVPLENCESKVEYSKMKATIYLSYRPIKNNLDSLLSDAYQMPSKHIIKASEIPEKVFVNPENKAYGTLFRIVGEAASQAQFFVTDSVNHFWWAPCIFTPVPIMIQFYLPLDMSKKTWSNSWKV